MQKEAQTRCETWFQFHISGHLWYRDSGMHSCSDKRGSWSDLVLLSIYVSTPASRRRKKKNQKKEKQTNIQHHAAVWPQGKGRGRGEGGRNVSFFKFLGFAGFWVRAVRDAETREREWASEQSFLQPRKEGRVSASVWLSDLQECRICGRALLHFFGRLAVTSCLLFLCRFTSLPSNPVSLDSARLQPLQRNSADWFVGYGPYCPVVFFLIQVCYCPVNFSSKGEGIERSVCFKLHSPIPIHETSLPFSPLPLHSYEGVLASYRPTTLPFSCLGEEQPGVGPL